MTESTNDYESRKIAGLCTYSNRCKGKAADGSNLCTRHRRAEAQRDRLRKQAKRKQMRSTGRCAFCGKKSKSYRCLECSVRLKASRVVSVPASVPAFDDRLERIRQRTVVGDDGRRRYHGQTRRGRQTVADLDEQDLDQLALQVAKAKAGLAYARRPEAADVPRIQRKESEHAAIGELVMGLRFGFDVCKRNGFEVPEAVEDDSEEDDE